MKFGLIVILCFPFYLQAQQKKGIVFEETKGWEQIKNIAKSQEKYIFVDCYATWCAPCKKMDKEVYTNDSLGLFFNNKFISVKVQMDRSPKDDKRIQNWYTDARRIEETYNVAAYPSFLFFSPEGKLVFKDIGFHDVSGMILLAQKALSPDNLIYYDELDNYKKGARDTAKLFRLSNYAKNIGQDSLALAIATDYLKYAKVTDLLSSDKILFVLKVAQDIPKAEQLAKRYKESILDKLPVNALLSKENLEFISNFDKLINAKDGYFHACYHQPAKVDSVLDFPGWANKVVRETIMREELEQKLLKDTLPLVSNPDWSQMTKTIQDKYREIDANMLVLDYQLRYFKTLKDWKNYTGSLIKRVDAYGAFGPIPDLDFNLNNHAWELFEHSTDKNELQKALTWSDSAINIVERSQNHFNLPNWMDTKANILYKLGNVPKAIAIQNKVIQLQPNNPEFQSNLEKMKKGQPTW